MQKWKQHVIKADAIRSKIGESLYDLGKHLIEVYNDSDWRVDQGIAGDDAASEWLTKHIGVCEFFELKGVIELFPDRADWKNKTYADMLRAVKEKLRAEQAAKRAEQQQPTHRVNYDHADPEAVLAASPRHVSPKVLETAVKEKRWAQSEVERLREENRRLHDDLAKARETIVELRTRLKVSTEKDSRQLVAQA